MANKSASGLAPWRVIYRDAGGDTNLIYRCEADDISHAIDQCSDENPAASIVGAAQEDAFDLLPGVGENFHLQAESAWVTVKNLSIHISGDAFGCEAEIFALGREDEESAGMCEASYRRTANDALLPGGEPRLDDLTQEQLEAHLEQLGPAAEKLRKDLQATPA